VWNRRLTWLIRFRQEEDSAERQVAGDQSCPKSRVKTQIKKFEAVLADGDAKKAGDEFRILTKRLDQTAATGLLHKRPWPARSPVWPGG